MIVLELEVLGFRAGGSCQIWSSHTMTSVTEVWHNWSSHITKYGQVDQLHEQFCMPALTVKHHFSHLEDLIFNYLLKFPTLFFCCCSTVKLMFYLPKKKNPSLFGPHKVWSKVDWIKLVQFCQMDVKVSLTESGDANHQHIRCDIKICV